MKDLHAERVIMQFVGKPSHPLPYIVGDPRMIKCGFSLLRRALWLWHPPKLSTFCQWKNHFFNRGYSCFSSLYRSHTSVMLWILKKLNHQFLINDQNITLLCKMNMHILMQYLHVLVCMETLHWYANKSVVKVNSECLTAIYMYQFLLP
jgi:hypothetical protein